MKTSLINSDSSLSLTLQKESSDSLLVWKDLYFRFEVVTSKGSQDHQKRDLARFLEFMREEYESTDRSAWTPRAARGFQTWLQSAIEEDGSRRWSDRTINRIIAHLKTFSKFIHKYRPFDLGNPMTKIKMLAIGNQLDIERAISKQERNRLLDAADQLLTIGGLSRDRSRHKGERRPQRKGYRPYRNRAILYTLIETGMRRAAITKIDLVGVNRKNSTISTIEKGGSVQTYPISKDGIEAIIDYLERERGLDFAKWQSPSLFLAASSVSRGDGRLSPKTVNNVWNEIRDKAGVDPDKTPHSARHGMGAHVIEKTGNIAAVQRQLGHKNAAFSMQYSRISRDDLQKVLDDR